VVGVVGETVMLLPVPLSGESPQEAPELHSYVAPSPLEPPSADNVVDSPLHIVAPAELVMPVGAVGGVFTVTAT
jgi:hypothetical protein